MKIDNHLLVKTVHAPERQVTIPCQEIKIDTIDQEIAVRWKNARHWKRTNEVGDGMEVLMVRSGGQWDIRMDDSKRFLYGMSVRQEYDENTNRVVTYLYKFPKSQHEIDVANRLIQKILPEMSIEIEGRFVVLKGGSDSFFTPVDMHEDIISGSISQRSSLLFGLFVAYGKANIQEGMLHNINIYLPLIGPSAQWTMRILELLNMLQQKGIFTTVTETNQKEGKLMHISISDWEFLEFIREYLKPVFGEVSVSRRHQMKQQKQLLLEFLSEHNAPAEVVSKIEDSVLKTVRK